MKYSASPNEVKYEKKYFYTCSYSNLFADDIRLRREIGQQYSRGFSNFEPGRQRYDQRDSAPTYRYSTSTWQTVAGNLPC
jgi:hypothetical protein